MQKQEEEDCFRERLEQIKRKKALQAEAEAEVEAQQRKLEEART